jgi:hypothetical protein
MERSQMRNIVQFDFARREWSVDRVLATLDDRVVFALIPIAVLLAGVLLQWLGAYEADARATAIQVELAREEPQIATVETLADQYNRKIDEYHALTDTRMSGPTLARSLTSWMNRVPRKIALTNVSANDDGESLSVSGTGPSIEEVRDGLINALRNVSSASLTVGKDVNYTVTTGAAASPSPRPAQAIPVAPGAGASSPEATP